MRFLAVLALCLITVTLPAQAAPPACNAGAEGTIVYNKDQKLVQFCNGSQWIGMVAAIGSGIDTLSNLSCASGEVPEWDGSDWVCGAGGTGLWTDSGSGYLTYTGADKGLLLHAVTGMAAPVSTLADLGCANTEILKWDGTAWACAADDAGALADNAVTNAKMADDAVGIAELSATGTASATTYLRGDNTWTSIPSSLWLNDGPGGPAEVYYNGGNVGIGTNDPSSALSVVGDISASSSVASSIVSTNTSLSGGVAQLYLGNTGAGGANWTINAGNTATGTLGARLGVAEGSNYRLVIEQGGNVGIGTTDPTQKLEVSGGYSLFGGLRLHGQDASVNQIWQSNAGTVLGITANGGDISLGQTSSPGSLVVKASGNVGIGTPTPGTALQVNGTVTATTFAGSGASLTSLNATNLASGAVATARLGSGTADSTTYLRGDGTWAAPSGSIPAGTHCGERVVRCNLNTLTYHDASVPHTGTYIYHTGTNIACNGTNITASCSSWNISSITCATGYAGRSEFMSGADLDQVHGGIYFYRLYCVKT